MTRAPAPCTRAGILDEAARIVTDDRNATYGEPEDLFGAIHLIWQGIDAARGQRSREPVDVGLYLAALKLARASANPDHGDSFTDLAGYAACAGEIAAQQARSATERAAEGALGVSGARDARQPVPGVWAPNSYTALRAALIGPVTDDGALFPSGWTPEMDTAGTKEG